MRRVIGIDIHRTFGEVVIWERGVLRHAGRVDMTRTALEGFGKTLEAADEVVIEATGNAMAAARALSPFVTRVVIANPLQVKAIAHAHVKTDKVDAGTLANLYAAGYLPEIWTPDAATERLRRLVARRYQIVRHRTRVKNEVHAILAAHLVPKCPHANLFNQRGRAWLARQVVPNDERVAIDRDIRAHPGEAGPPGRRGGARPQAHRVVLASADEGRGLSLGAAGTGRQEDARHGAPSRAAAEERQPAWSGLSLQRQGAPRPRGRDRTTGRAQLRAVRRALEGATAQGAGRGPKLFDAI